MRWISAVLLVLFGACGLDEVGEQAREERDARKAAARADVELASCGLEDERMAASVEVVNGSSERSNYLVKVAFVSLDGAEQFATGSAYVSGLAPDQRAVDDVAAYQDPAGEFDCELIDVTRISDE